jgi:hypothetical protein
MAAFGVATEGIARPSAADMRCPLDNLGPGASTEYSYRKMVDAYCLFNYERSLTGNLADLPDVVLGVSAKPVDHGPNHWSSPAAFSSPALGSFWNRGRNMLVPATH